MTLGVGSPDRREADCTDEELARPVAGQTVIRET